jgi:hypothetical protein
VSRFYTYRIALTELDSLRPSQVIKTTGTLVILCTRMLLCSVVEFLCVRGAGRYPCSCVGILAAVLCVLCGGIEAVKGGWQTSPSPSHYTVGTQGRMLVGGGGAIVT